ncbi:hypothetical protein NST33_18290 [Paenibacillus sp. FSL L8-0435]|uniref:hypothetical protein n=1 Tax=Paenibacillus sp. FSL L8-0435 TaxID=2954618 RepID=UPI0030D9BD2B
MIMKNNDEFSHIINDYFGSKYSKDSKEIDVWGQSNTIVVELEGEKYLRQTRYYPYDLEFSRKLAHEDWEYIIDNHTRVLLIHEDGSFDFLSA